MKSTSIIGNKFKKKLNILLKRQRILNSYYSRSKYPKARDFNPVRDWTGKREISVILLFVLESPALNVRVSWYGSWPDWVGSVVYAFFKRTKITRNTYPESYRSCLAVGVLQKDHEFLIDKLKDTWTYMARVLTNWLVCRELWEDLQCHILGRMRN